MSTFDEEHIVSLLQRPAVDERTPRRPSRLAVAQANIARQLLLQDMAVSVESDFAAFGRAVAQLPAEHSMRLGVFDPASNTLGTGNAFWLAARDSDGTLVAACAQRIWHNTSFVELVNQGRFLYDGSKPAGPDSFVLIGDGLDHVCGNIALICGGWLQPLSGHRALPPLVMLLAQAKLMQDFDADYCLSVVPPALVSEGVAVNGYRFNHLDFGAMWCRQGAASTQDFWIIHNGAADMERELSLWSRGNG